MVRRNWGVSGWGMRNISAAGAWRCCVTSMAAAFPWRRFPAGKASSQASLASGLTDPGFVRDPGGLGVGGPCGGCQLFDSPVGETGQAGEEVEAVGAGVDAPLTAVAGQGVRRRRRGFWLGRRPRTASSFWRWRWAGSSFPQGCHRKLRGNSVGNLVAAQLLSLIAQPGRGSNATRTVRVKIRGQRGTMQALLAGCFAGLNIADFQYGKNDRNDAWLVVTARASDVGRAAGSAGGCWRHRGRLGRT